MDEIDKFYSEQEQKSNTSKYRKCINFFKNNEEMHELFTYNLFSKSIEFTRVPNWDYSRKKGDELTDNDLINIRTYVTLKNSADFPKDNILDAIIYFSLLKSYHPIKDWLDALEWDGVNRLDTWLTKVCGCSDNAYTRAASSKLLIAAVKRIYEPGCKFDTLAILEGKQGIRKSTLIEALAGEKYYSTLSFQLNNKDIVDKMRGKWFLEVAELHGFSKQDAERVKSLVSEKTDRVRLSYGRLADDFKRQSIMIGTINPDGENRYFVDQTGNRRYWPIVCESRIDIEYLMQIRQQLFAEAVVRYKNNEEIYITDDSINKHLLEIQEERRGIDPWEEIISDWVNKKIQLDLKARIKMADVFRECLNISTEKLTLSLQQRAGRILINSGFLKKRENKGNRDYYYELKYSEQERIRNEAQEISRSEVLQWQE